MNPWFVVGLAAFVILGIIVILIALGIHKYYQDQEALREEYELGIVVNAILKQDIIGKETARDIIEQCQHYDYEEMGGRLVPRGERFFRETQRASMMINQWLEFLPDSEEIENMSPEEAEKELDARTQNYLSWRKVSEDAVVSSVVRVIPEKYDA